MTTSSSLTARASQRAAQRARDRRRTIVRVSLLAVVALLVGGAVTWWVLMSSALAVESVRVVGVERLSADQVRRQAAVPDGAALATVDLDKVQRRVGDLAAVAAVEVVRDWPAALVIRVRERTPAAVLFRSDAWLLLDGGGTAFDRLEKRPKGLPAVTTPSGGGEEALRAALRVLDVLPADVRAEVRQVSASSPDDVRLRLSRNRTVVWGSDERNARKSAVLDVLLTRKARVYDVSAPDIPTTAK